jgi:hypothetical protein
MVFQNASVALALLPYSPATTSFAFAFLSSLWGRASDSHSISIFKGYMGHFKKGKAPAYRISAKQQMRYAYGKSRQPAHTLEGYSATRHFPFRAFKGGWTDSHTLFANSLFTGILSWDSDPDSLFEAHPLPPLCQSTWRMETGIAYAATS